MFKAESGSLARDHMTTEGLFLSLWISSCITSRWCCRVLLAKFSSLYIWHTCILFKIERLLKNLQLMPNSCFFNGQWPQCSLTNLTTDLPIYDRYIYIYIYMYNLSSLQSLTFHQGMHTYMHNFIAALLVERVLLCTTLMLHIVFFW